MSTTLPNKVFFEHGNIKITGARFETGFESYPVRKISGVRIEAGKRNARTGIALMVAGSAALLGGMFGNIPVLLVTGAAFTVGGAMIFFAKVNSTVVLTTRGHDVRALTSKDSALIGSVAAALSEVIANRN